VRRELGGDHGRQVVEDVELALVLLVVVAGNQQVNVERGLESIENEFKKLIYFHKYIAPIISPDSAEFKTHFC